MGYVPVARSQGPRKITVYRQGDIKISFNEEPGTHGLTSSPRTGRVRPRWRFVWSTQRQAYERAIALGAEPSGVCPRRKRSTFRDQGIGGSLLYFVVATAPRFGLWTRVRMAWREQSVAGRRGLFYLDHLP